jgi:D-alanyl-D-alanine-carboxypeptidase/D-alanyl-D-alanine-endopeptidase
MFCKTKRVLTAAAILCAAGCALPASAQAPATPAPLARIAPQMDQIFTKFMADNHVPGLVYGVVAHGHLEYVKPFGVQDMDAKRPVTPGSLFRIASMTKAFTALTLLHLRDEGKVALQANAETYIPELRGWHYPTSDSPKIRVIDLLGHTPGFVTDDPWGDRQTPIPESQFTDMLKKGIAFDHAPATAFSYSNLGFAMVGRIIANVEKRPYSAVAGDLLLKPLGMSSSGFNIANSPVDKRAIGYRFENGAYAREPDLGEGAFTSIGGLQTSANDYAKWVAYLLSAWPPRSDTDTGPVPRQTIRELAKGSDFPLGVTRPGDKRPNPCRQAEVYGMALYVVNDCDLPLAITHNGGYPGYGSSVLMFPEAGVGLFVFTNRTYSSPSPNLWNAALMLKAAGMLNPRPVPVSPQLAKAYDAAGASWRDGVIAPMATMAAVNFFLDRTADNWKLELARLKTQVGDCKTDAPIHAMGTETGSFEWACQRGRIKGRLLLAPPNDYKVQSLIYDVMPAG